MEKTALRVRNARTVRINKGILWMIVAALFFALMGACVKTATTTASTAQAIFFRAVVGIPFLVWIALRNRIPLLGTGNRGLLFFRGIFGFSALTLYFFSIARIPLGDAVILNATAPIFVVLWAGPFLGETVPRSIFLFLPIFLTGVVMIVKPTLSPDWIPSLAALASGLFGSISYITVRRLGKTEHTTTVVFYFSVVSLLGSIPLVLADWHPLTAVNLLPLILAGLFATAGQLAMTKAYKLERASVVSLYGYAGPIFAYLLALLLFHEIPDRWALIGTTLIVGSAAVIYRGTLNPLRDSSEPT